jgi:hypothetical protein
MLLQRCDCWSQGAHDRIRQCCIWPWALTIARFACRKPVEGAGRDGAGGMTGLDSSGEHAGVVVCVSAGVPLRLESELLAASVAVLGGDGRWGSSVAAFAARGARKVS